MGAQAKFDKDPGEDRPPVEAAPAPAACLSHSSLLYQWRSLGLSLFGLSQQTPETDVYFPQFRRLGASVNEGAGRCGSWGLFPARRRPPPSCALPWQRQQELWSLSFPFLGTLSHHGHPTLTTSSKPHFLPKALPPSSIKVKVWALVSNTWSLCFS